MTYNIKDNGDWLEQHSASFISENIPAYELIWQNYIGHKGSGKIAEMLSKSNEVKKKG